MTRKQWIRLLQRGIAYLSQAQRETKKKAITSLFGYYTLDQVSDRLNRDGVAVSRRLTDETLPVKVFSSKRKLWKTLRSFSSCSEEKARAIFWDRDAKLSENSIKIRAMTCVLKWLQGEPRLSFERVSSDIPRGADIAERLQVCRVLQQLLEQKDLPRYEEASLLRHHFNAWYRGEDSAGAFRCLENFANSGKKALTLSALIEKHFKRQETNESYQPHIKPLRSLTASE